jgi:hypothetical protein
MVVHPYGSTAIVTGNYHEREWTKESLGSAPAFHGYSDFPEWKMAVCGQSLQCKTKVGDLPKTYLSHGQEWAAVDQHGEAFFRISISRPSSSTRIMSQLLSVLRRWAIMNVVRPLMSFSVASIMVASV